MNIYASIVYDMGVDLGVTRGHIQCDITRAYIDVETEEENETVVGSTTLG